MQGVRGGGVFGEFPGGDERECDHVPPGRLTRQDPLHVDFPLPRHRTRRLPHRTRLPRTLPSGEHNRRLVIIKIIIEKVHVPKKTAIMESFNE